jgi:hypothetical protein
LAGRATITKNTTIAAILPETFVLVVVVVVVPLAS